MSVFTNRAEQKNCRLPNLSKLQMNLLYKMLLLLTVVSVGCSTVKLPVESALPTMPTTYRGGTDTLDAAMLTRSYFFTDAKLISLIDTALARNTDLLNAYQNIEIARANTQLTKGAMRPFVNAAFLPGVQRFGLYTMDGAGNKNTEIYNGSDIPTILPDFFGGFQSVWEIDAWGKLKNRNKAAVTRYLSSIEGRKWLQVNLVNTIAVNYYELLALDNQLASIQQSLAIQQDVLRLVRIQKEAGRGTELAINQFEAQMLNAKALAKELEQAILENENNINLLLSRYPQPIERNSDWLTVQNKKLVAGIPSQLLQNRPDIRSAELDLAASRFDVLAAKKAFYPTITINAALGLQAFSPATFVRPQSITFGLFGGLLAPIFNKSALQSEFNTQSAVQLQVLNNYQQTMVTAFGEVFTLVKKIENLQEMIDLKKAEVQILQKAVSNAKTLFQAARAEYLEVLTAQQNLLDANLALGQYKKTQNQETANLFKAVGGGWR
jgi:outer membrane protein, multidrug efflux system